MLAGTSKTTTCSDLMRSLSSIEPWHLPNQHLRVKDICHRNAWSLTVRTHLRGSCIQTHARKGFGTALPRLPPLSGRDKVPTGGVAPSAPVDLGIPEELERLWSGARDEWKRRSIEQPVVLPVERAKVHLVPVGADLPADAALIHDVVAAVQPDAIALESPPQHLKSYTSIAKALEPQLTHLLSSGSRSLTAARACFTQRQREELQTSLLQACRAASIKPDPDQLMHLFRLGSLPFVEWLVPAHLVRTFRSSVTSASGRGGGIGVKQQPQQPMLLVSCGLDRQARAALPAASLFFGREFDLYLEEVEAALGEGAAGELAAWRSALGDRLEACGAGRELAILLTAWEAQCCLGPEQQRAVVRRVEERMRDEGGKEQGRGYGSEVTRSPGADVEAALELEMVRRPADPLVARQLAELASGKNVVRKPQCIVAVVGRVHALSVEDELLKIGGKQL
ncbi:hypothetical protein Vretimale_1538 [Volvox reticuliferus]|uniref:Uncharacterized protein n=2 Tax=Volvox reticuliferus TaxID=1737510 RepID=A0A8J4G3H2_9CHLO|nr:hypothetical protein Vretimale_1538 [Volvox reticuliferus]